MIPVDKKKILLIQPPFFRLFKDTHSLNRYPLSLGYLAENIYAKTKWDVQAYNADFSEVEEAVTYKYVINDGFYRYLEHLRDTSAPIWGEVRSAISDYHPSVIGISATSQGFLSAAIVARIAKDIDPRITVIAGGPHVSMVGIKILECADIDICVRGEGEDAIVELLNAIEAGSALDTVRGIIYRKGQEVVETSARAYIRDLDALPFPSTHAPLLLKGYSKYPLAAFKSIFATRGCPNDCLFCGSKNIWSRVTRFRSPANVAQEIKALQAMGLGEVHFADDTFGSNERYLKELCEEIQTHCKGVRWSCEIHVRLVNDRTISIMKAAGCFSIQLGIESGNNEILRKIRKNFTIEEALTAADVIKKHGLRLETFFMVGLPDETVDTLSDTFNVMKNIKCDSIVYSIFAPYPGTEAFDLCRQRGLVDDAHNTALLNHQSPESCYCDKIPKEEFRKRASEIEEWVDSRNHALELMGIFSFRKIRRLKELGLSKSIKKIKDFFAPPYRR